jgi:hypothetical protein
MPIRSYCVFYHLLSDDEIFLTIDLKFSATGYKEIYHYYIRKNLAPRHMGQRKGARHLRATPDVKQTSSPYPTYVTNGVALQATSKILKGIF